MTNEKKTIVIAFILIIISLVNILFIHYLNRYILILILFIISAIFLKMLGFEKNNHRYQKDIILQILIMSFVYYIAIYVIGYFTGFVENAYHFTPKVIISVIIPAMLLIIIKETIRYTVCSRFNDKKWIIILITIALILTDITLVFHNYDIRVGKELFTLISYQILPSITQNIFITYLCMKVGIKTQVIYVMLKDLPYYIIPIIPDMGIYMDSIIKTVLPMIYLIIILNIFIRQSLSISVRKKSHVSKIIYAVVFVFVSCLVALTSTYFRYFFLTIASGSMHPAINKGDIVVVEKCDISQLKENDVLVFREGTVTIVHRVMEIKQDDKDIILKTKGDNNEQIDNYNIEKEEVVGKVKLKIPYLGYPTVYINELFS